MINNETTSNTKLTLEQLQQIDIVESKLAELNTQIAVKEKNLKVITNDTNRFAREIEAQKPVLEDLKTQVEDETKQLNYLASEISQSNTILTKLNDEINAKTEAQNKKESELKDREGAVQRKEIEITKVEDLLGVKVSTHAEESKTFNSKVAKLKEVISTF